MKTTTFTLFLAIFVATLDFVMMIPIGPVIAKEIGLGIENTSLLISIYPLFAVLSGLLSAPFSDYFGRKPMLIILTTGLITVSLLSVYSFTAFQFVALRAFAGVFAGILMPTAIAYAGDAASDAKRAKVVTWALLAIPVASTIGVPFMAWLVSQTHWQMAFITIACLSLLSLLFVLALTHIQTGIEHFKPVELYKELFSLWQHPATRIMLVIEFLLVLVVYSIVPQLGPWLELNFALSTVEIGVCFLVGGIGAILGNLIASYYVRGGARIKPIVIGSLLLMLSTIIATASWLPAVFVSGLLFFMMMGDASRYPSIQVILTEIAPPKLRGRLLLMNMVVTNFAMAIGGAISSLLVNSENGKLIGMGNIAMMIVLISLATFYALHLRHRQLENNLYPSNLEMLGSARAAWFDSKA